ncbi:MAG TPA: hypothetical protein PK079_24255 [Leptospiraceae bacterium]|nr:hypothetical protein [Leptospiraceae bacterium]HMW07086.1 hypothetical protein [Leptospiraceae bacterium]HMX32260.1 hypothetical protein [Leptospiraceae bacterium]HMY32597.1 hypothetical protein [Leptospiraceae bacterium]HNA06824.1 hypothetical protein [Leptospiraceae bacterium]
MSNKFLIIFLFYFFILSFCKVDKTSGESIPVVETPESKALQMKSLFLSGKLQADDTSKLGKITRTSYYATFRQRITKHWEQYNKEIQDPFVEWKNKNVPEPKSKVVFYPFSGPDFPNAFTIYPKAQTYIMIGLEAGGFDPDIENMNENQIARGLAELNGSLDTISRLNYFMTNSMKQDVSKSVFRGTAPVFLAYFGFLKVKPYSIKNFYLNDNGDIIYLSKEDIKANANYREGLVSLDIDFLDPVDGSKKKLYFLSTNISNFGLKANPGTMKFLGKFGMFASTFKAASFLLHYDSFTDMKEFIIKNSELMVMDDTGPPVRDLAKDYNIKVFGRYTRPIGLWPEKVQKELQKLHEEQKPEKVSFKYGYGTADKQQHIMVVTRK